MTILSPRFCISVTLAALICIMTISVVSSVADSLPEPEGKALWTYISETSPYTQWGQFDEHNGMQPGNAPHGTMHALFVNNIGLASKGQAQYGTIMVKANYGADNLLKAFTVMYKSKGYGQDTGDWFWAKYSPEGEVQAEGQPKGCVGCHKSMKDNDWTMTHLW
ncbi:cytochrome P460 family protein [Oleidesulfovibrio sp.]|uniref:cytochrome P460 family protein n=1 Tax=Oleidesulfovibrio sp. TaxID=2909707 RepID=UPI003A870E1E